MALEIQSQKSSGTWTCMIIYLAGGMTVMNVKGREREMSELFPCWNRLLSYHFKDIWMDQTFQLTGQQYYENIFSPKCNY